METGKFSWIKIIWLVLGIVSYLFIAFNSPFLYLMLGILVLFLLSIILIFDVDALLRKLIRPKVKDITVLGLMDLDDFFDDIYDIIKKENETYDDRANEIISFLKSHQEIPEDAVKEEN